MLWVSARRQGLFDSTWAKPTLYVSFWASFGNSAQASEAVNATADATTVPTSNFRRLIIDNLPIVLQVQRKQHFASLLNSCADRIFSQAAMDGSMHCRRATGRVVGRLCPPETLLRCNDNA